MMFSRSEPLVGRYGRVLFWSVIVAGMPVAYLTAVAGGIPEHPLDLMSYIGGYYAATDGMDAYDAEDAISSLRSREDVS